jgi:hypothetical protein
VDFSKEKFGVSVPIISSKETTKTYTVFLPSLKYRGVDFSKEKFGVSEPV